MRMRCFILLRKVADACEEASASSDEQLTAIHSATEASEQLNDFSDELAVALNRASNYSVHAQYLATDAKSHKQTARAIAL